MISYLRAFRRRFLPTSQETRKVEMNRIEVERIVFNRVLVGWESEIF